MYDFKFTSIGIDSTLLQSEVQCGYYPGYYPTQDATNPKSSIFCKDYYNFAKKIVGGCSYDLGAGNCLTVDVYPNSIGCASAIETYMISLIQPHALMLLGCSAFNMLFMITSCCMWWKRKSSDVFPEFLTEKKVSS